MDDPTYWTARVAMLLYAASLGARLAVPKATGTARWLHTVGCAALLVHVTIAFQVHHHWSHTAARTHVEQRTAELTGVASGAGLWVNYLFAALWVADVAYWWVGGNVAYRRRRPSVTFAIHAFLLFVAFNATIVFAHGPARVASIVVCIGLAMIAVAALARRRTRTSAFTGTAR